MDGGSSIDRDTVLHQEASIDQAVRQLDVSSNDASSLASTKPDVIRDGGGGGGGT